MKVLVSSSFTKLLRLHTTTAHGPGHTTSTGTTAGTAASTSAAAAARAAAGTPPLGGASAAACWRRQGAPWLMVVMVNGEVSSAMQGTTAHRDREW